MINAFHLECHNIASSLPEPDIFGPGVSIAPAVRVTVCSITVYVAATITRIGSAIIGDEIGIVGVGWIDGLVR